MYIHFLSSLQEDCIINIYRWRALSYSSLYTQWWHNNNVHQQHLRRRLFFWLVVVYHQIASPFAGLVGYRHLNDIHSFSRIVVVHWPTHRYRCIDCIDDFDTHVWNFYISYHKRGNDIWKRENKIDKDFSEKASLENCSFFMVLCSDLSVDAQFCDKIKLESVRFTCIASTFTTELYQLSVYQM